MQNMIATFYTHYGAMTFSNHLKNQGIEGKLSPVPRRLSSSCGTCVRFAAHQDIALALVDEEMEMLVIERPSKDHILIDQR